MLGRLEVQRFDPRVLRIPDQLGVPALSERAALDTREPGSEQRIPKVSKSQMD